MRIKLALLTCLVLFSYSALAAAEPPPHPAKLIIGPPGENQLRELFEHPDQWSHIRPKIGALLYADHNLNQFGDAELRGWFVSMRKWRLPLELEVGAIKEWGRTADATLAAEEPIWNRMISLGADLGSVAMDEPLLASRNLLHESDGYALDQTAGFVAMVRARHPSILIGDVEPYPSISAKDHLAWIQALQQRLVALGVRPLDFYRLDVDWIAFASPGAHGNWREVASLDAAINRLGISFSLIYWASGYPSEKARGLAGEDTWYQEVMREGLAFAKLGARPDQFVLESWIGVPTKSLPDTNALTFTGSALAFERKFISRPE